MSTSKSQLDVFVLKKFQCHPIYKSRYNQTRKTFDISIHFGSHPGLNTTVRLRNSHAKGPNSKRSEQAEELAAAHFLEILQGEEKITVTSKQHNTFFSFDRRLLFERSIEGVPRVIWVINCKYTSPTSFQNSAIDIGQEDSFIFVDPSHETIEFLQDLFSPEPLLRVTATDDLANLKQTRLVVSLATFSGVLDNLLLRIRSIWNTLSWADQCSDRYHVVVVHFRETEKALEKMENLYPHDYPNLSWEARS